MDRPCASSRVSSAARRRTDPRSTPPCSGRPTGRSGSTWSTSTRPSARAATASCSPRSSVVSTSRSSSPAASATTPRSRPRWRRAAPASTSAPLRWRTRPGAPRSSASTATRSPSGSTSAARTLAARGWTQEGGDLFEVLERLERDGCARYVVTDVTKDGTLTGPNLDLLREVCARTEKPVVASGGVSSLRGPA